MRFLLAVLAVLAATPFTLAHDPPGTLKDYCEPGSEWEQHDYVAVNGLPPFPHLLRSDVGPVAAPFHGEPATLFPMDGNLLGDCSGTTSLGSPCAGFEDVNDPTSVYAGMCGFDGPVADWDGHDEFALGGAVLLVDSGSGVPSGNPMVGSGSLYCYGGVGHHSSFGPVSVTDVVLGAGATFTVAADNVDVVGLTDGCGDLQQDQSSDCVGMCTVTFLAGLDGAYVVYVQGTAGHVDWW